MIDHTLAESPRLLQTISSPVSVAILGERFQIRFVPVVVDEDGREKPEYLGLTSQANRDVQISTRQSADSAIETVAHEIAHLCVWAGLRIATSDAARCADVDRKSRFAIYDFGLTASPEEESHVSAMATYAVTVMRAVRRLGGRRGIRERIEAA